jgi:hypothetical protein
MIQRRAKAAASRRASAIIPFRATGVTAYLKNSGKLEVAQHMPIMNRPPDDETVRPAAG